MRQAAPFPSLQDDVQQSRSALGSPWGSVRSTPERGAVRRTPGRGAVWSSPQWLPAAPTTHPAGRKELDSSAAPYETHPACASSATSISHTVICYTELDVQCEEVPLWFTVVKKLVLCLYRASCIWSPSW